MAETKRRPPTQKRRRSRQDNLDNEETRRRLLSAAREEFARLGLMGARVDLIARKANANKQLIYYHFGDKDGLYAAVLEESYRDIRLRERQLELDSLDPEAAMKRLVAFTFDYVVSTPSFVALVTDENVHRAQHLKDSAVVRELRTPFVDLLAETLVRGEREGIFRGGVDPAQFYMSLAGMCFFYFANIHTLSALFGSNLQSDEAIELRRAHVIEFAMASLRP